MASGLLSLKWNNHRSTFFHVLSTIRSKESYCDVTLACDGRFYALHKFVLSTCSEYFEEMFERTQCKHPVIVLKDIKYEDLEALLNYMYIGEVNVVQEKLSDLIKAAECLKIKGLAVPDEDPMESQSKGLIREQPQQQQQHKRSQRTTESSPHAKRRRREYSSDISDEIISPVRSRPTARSRDHIGSNINKSVLTSSEDTQHQNNTDDHQDNIHDGADNSSISENRLNDSSNRNNKLSSHRSKSEPEEVVLDDDIKPEPVEIDDDDDHHAEENHPPNSEEDNKASLNEQLGFDPTDQMEGGFEDVDHAMMGSHAQGMDDAAMPGSSGFQENSFPLWEGEGSLSNFPVEGFSGDNSQARQMVGSLSSLGGTMGRHSSGSGGITGAGSLATHCCPYCSRQFRVARDLSRHVLTHTGEKPHRCPICEHRSARTDSLRLHFLNKHPELAQSQQVYGIAGTANTGQYWTQVCSVANTANAGQY